MRYEVGLIPSHNGSLMAASALPSHEFPASPEETGPRIHVAIVEDDLGFRSALARALSAAPDMRLAGTAGTQAEGIALLSGPPMDVLLVDLGLPDGSGIEVIRAAARQWPSCSIMVSTNFGDETHVMRSIEAGDPGARRELEISAGGPGRLYYAARMSYAEAPAAARLVNAGLEVRREYSVQRNGSWVLLGEPATALRLACIGLIVSGIVGLKLVA